MFRVKSKHEIKEGNIVVNLIVSSLLIVVFCLPSMAGTYVDKGDPCPPGTRKTGAQDCTQRNAARAICSSYRNARIATAGKQWSICTTRCPVSSDPAGCVKSGNKRKYIALSDATARWIACRARAPKCKVWCEDIPPPAPPPSGCPYAGMGKCPYGYY